MLLLSIAGTGDDRRTASRTGCRVVAAPEARSLGSPPLRPRPRPSSLIRQTSVQKLLRPSVRPGNKDGSRSRTGRFEVRYDRMPLRIDRTGKESIRRSGDPAPQSGSKLSLAVVVTRDRPGLRIRRARCTHRVRRASEVERHFQLDRAARPRSSDW